MPPSAAALLLPWDFSPTVLVTIALAVTLYTVGSERAVLPISGLRRVAFYLGLTLIYCALQTRWDYYAGHMFFVHRTQHFVLHDIGPALLAASAPAAVLATGLPGWLARRVTQMTARLRPIAHMAFDPWTATAMYIASLIIWIPGTVFLVTIAMLVLRRILHQEYTAQTARMPQAAQTE